MPSPRLEMTLAPKTRWKRGPSRRGGGGLASESGVADGVVVLLMFLGAGEWVARRHGWTRWGSVASRASGRDGVGAPRPRGGRADAGAACDHPGRAGAVRAAADRRVH